MTELLKAVTSPWNLLWVVVVFGFAPGFCLRLIVRAYPPDDPRRDELIAELYAVPSIKRPLWVAEQLEVALFEGLVRRVSAAIRRLGDRRRARAEADKDSEEPAKPAKSVKVVPHRRRVNRYRRRARASQGRLSMSVAAGACSAGLLLSVVGAPFPLRVTSFAFAMGGMYVAVVCMARALGLIDFIKPPRPRRPPAAPIRRRARWSRPSGTS